MASAAAPVVARRLPELPSKGLACVIAPWTTASMVFPFRPALGLHHQVLKVRDHRRDVLVAQLDEAHHRHTTLNSDADGALILAPDSWSKPHLTLSIQTVARLATNASGLLIKYHLAASEELLGRWGPTAPHRRSASGRRHSGTAGDRSRGWRRGGGSRRGRSRRCCCHWRWRLHRGRNCWRN